MHLDYSTNKLIYLVNELHLITTRTYHHENDFINLFFSITILKRLKIMLARVLVDVAYRRLIFLSCFQ